MKLPVCAVVGDPVARSRSPEIFRFLAARQGVPLEYVRLEVPAVRFTEALSAARRSGLFRGWNVTIPHKEQAAALAEETSPDVRATGAANVLRFSGHGDSGRVRAFNTDVLGITRSLAAHGARLRGRRAVVLGAGGAARAAVLALVRCGAAEVLVANRTVARARRVARDLALASPRTALTVLPWDEVAGLPGPVAGVIQATPLGTDGGPWPAGPLLPAEVVRGGFALDVVYRPAMTAFLDEARSRGLEPIGGLEMLVRQAVAAWEIWFGPITNRGALEAALLSHLGGAT